mmetsp:Transcript_49648/g.108034  ORF Transcript_49648/g.108034 Transcript_49648/m.108034 type:complete len:276 (+) Transcript_49648:793-1620(+)
MSSNMLWRAAKREMAAAWSATATLDCRLGGGAAGREHFLKSRSTSSLLPLRTACRSFSATSSESSSADSACSWTSRKASAIEPTAGAVAKVGAAGCGAGAGTFVASYEKSKPSRPLASTGGRAVGAAIGGDAAKSAVQEVVALASSLPPSRSPPRRSPAGAAEVLLGCALSLPPSRSPPRRSPATGTGALIGGSSIGDERRSAKVLDAGRAAGAATAAPAEAATPASAATAAPEATEAAAEATGGCSLHQRFSLYFCFINFRTRSSSLFCGSSNS